MSLTPGLPETPVRVLMLHSHPVQYNVPLYRQYSRRLELVVAYCSLRGAVPAIDADFEREVGWDTDLLSGYRYELLRRTSKSVPRPVRDFYLRIWPLITRGRFDLVVSAGYSDPTAWLSLLAAKRAGAKWAFVGDSYTLEGEGGRVRFGKPLLLKLLCRVADGVAAESNRSRAHFQKFAGQKVWLVPHAVDDEWFADVARAADRGETRRRFATVESSVVAVFVGKLIPRKRVSDLIDAVSQVDGMVLWIVGSGPDEQRLRQQARNLAEQVRFLGFRNQSELPAIYDAADFVVLPSKFETFGLVVAEGAALGRTAVVTNACGVVDSLVLDGDTGLVVAPGDRTALAQALRRMTRREEREKLSHRMTRVAQSWTAQANAEAFARFCREVVSGERLDDRIVSS